MWNEYVREKLLELEHERVDLKATRPAPDAPAAADEHRLLAPVVRFAGRRVRRVGEALEDWAAPPRARSDSHEHQSFWV